MITKVDNHNWKTSWQLLSLTLAISFGFVGFAATKALLNLPDNASCHNLSLWFTSATNRIYCAQLRAEENTVEDLLAAIGLLEALPADHPLSHELNRHINEWSNDILTLAEKDLNKGKLEKAIATANKIPQNAENKKIIENQINLWRFTWEKGKNIEEEVKANLRKGQWNSAFIVAVDFLNMSNDYWKNVRYPQMVEIINVAKEENKKLDDAYTSIRGGGIDNLLKTIEVANQIPKNSYSYDEAQALITDAENDLLKIATNLLKKKNWSDLARLSNQISTTSRLTTQAVDWNTLARAGKNVQLGTISGVELAITEAEQIPSESKIYAQTQDLIKGWSRQKEDLSHLVNARNLAKSGTVTDLSSAITKAQLVRQGNTLHSDAQREIRTWRREIQVIEDRPIINQAKDFARNNTVQGWQSAINQISQINGDRALASEARSLTAQWRGNIESAQDRPVLQRAIALSNSNQYQEAINTARNITRGRSLYGEAQTNIRKWQTEINAQQSLDNAYEIARNNNEQSLLRAINIARSISPTSSAGFQSRQAINLWSEQMLNMAQRMADTYNLSDLEKAISIAGMIPRGNSAYSRAQNRIQQWNERLYPSSLNLESTLQETDFSIDN